MKNSPNTGFGWQTAGARGDAALFDEGLRQHMLRVFNYMGLGLALTGIVAYIVGTTPALYVPIFQTPLKYVVMLAPLAFVLFFSFKIESLSASTAQALFWAFCGVMGLSLASIFLVFTGTSIARTLQFGSLLIMGLIGVVIASIVNLFLGSTALQFAISVIGIVVFVGLTAWDTQSIKEQYASSLGHEETQKMAVFGAFSLYLNFVNIFQLLLDFTGERE
jgi:FtsH-binding integral membrane protein